MAIHLIALVVLSIIGVLMGWYILYDSLNLWIFVADLAMLLLTLLYAITLFVATQEYILFLVPAIWLLGVMLPAMAIPFGVFFIVREEDLYGPS